MTWADSTLIGFDLETTGVDVETARIVTASVVRVDVESGKVDTRDWLIAVDIDIPTGATNVHGVTTEHARTNGVTAIQALTDIYGELHQAWADCYPVVAFNAAYDLTVLDRELCRHAPAIGYSWQGSIGAVIDPFVVDKACDRYRKGSRRLVDVCAHYGITLTADEAHTSAGDALAAARLAWKLARVFPEVGACDLTGLQQRQISWAADSAFSYRTFLDRKLGKLLRESGLADGGSASAAVLAEVAELEQRMASVSGEWPLRARTGPVK
jgi:DNA polymerase-3 subunit epsilon